MSFEFYRVSYVTFIDGKRYCFHMWIEGRDSSEVLSETVCFSGDGEAAWSWLNSCADRAWGWFVFPERSLFRKRKRLKVSFCFASDEFDAASVKEVRFIKAYERYVPTLEELRKKPIDQILKWCEAHNLFLPVSTIQEERGR